ncbi:uncharacterized protein BYT42DRAFT_494763 [Radiomyces spectabilis]|uniref:uncharacterized protein n=1 Tax=Radiomyces spectabilis TaxID=64574 RepID=UPI0022207D6E|nr:uncharacterized protein BYT42DRAFT_494763 [Radiomyces spectabilis]KAI8381423.1 hypothetical protein BYT42DRAFT_494763 [Radiomyces spectabilis]
MTTTIRGDQFIRTLRHYLDTNESKLLDTLSRSRGARPLSSAGRTERESDAASLGSSTNLHQGTRINNPPSSLYGIPIPYMSLLAATSPHATSVGMTPYMPPNHSCLTLDIHYLYFLLVQFDHIGLDIGDPSLLGDIPEHGIIETETSETAGKAPSIMSVGSIASTMSTFSLSSGWNFWQRKAQTKPSDRPIHEDVASIYRFLERITALKLQLSLSIDTQTGVTRSSPRVISGYEQSLPQDGSVLISLRPFHHLTFLELDKVHPRCLDGWNELQRRLVSLVIRGAGVEDAADALEERWRHLKMLSLADNNLTTLDPEPLQHIRSITHINLASNLLIDVPAALSNLYNLQSLNLSYNMISFTTGINTILGNIQELDLRGNRLTMLAGLERLWALERLDLRDNRIEDAAEVGRLTTLPNINDIWIQGNPFTKTQPDYRVDLFNMFKAADLDIHLDGTKPAFSERRRIVATPVRDGYRAAAAAVNTEAVKRWPTAQPSAAIGDTDSANSEQSQKIKMARPKSKKVKRVVRLGGEEGARETGEDTASKHRLAELEQSVKQEALARKASRKQRRARSVHRSESSEEEKANRPRSVSPVSDRHSDSFRRKIETMRREAGTEWLRVLQEMKLGDEPDHPSSLQKWTYDVALWIFNIMLEIFFREVRPRGAHKIPKDGPVIFVAAPHANQFVDPIILMRECGRRVSFLIAEKSMHQRGIGFFARMVNAIPVTRPQDLAVPGKGRIQLLNRKTDPLRITGIDTQFLSQLRPRDSIALPKGVGTAEVVEVISDTMLIIKKEFKELKALELLTANDGAPYKCLPHIEQESVYRSVHEELNKGQCITIFPEGGSHDRYEMLPLKAGVTVMALGAMAKYPGLDVKIVPCGLNYFHAHRFRSRAVIEFGNPITISSELVDKFKMGGSDKREACGKLLDTIYGGLKSVTVNAGSYETLMLIQAARRLYKPAHRKLQISQVVDLNRRFLIGYQFFKDDPKVIDLQQRVLAYNQLLKYHGIRDHQVSRTHIGGWSTLFLFLKRLAILTLLTLWAFPGAILNLPVVIIAKIISQKKAQAALKGSVVKIAGRDVLATWKLLVGLVLLPTLYALYSFMMLIVVLRTSWDFKWKIILPLITWNMLPFVSYASLRFGEIGHDILRSLQPIIMAMLDPDAAEILRHNREKLSQDITSLINEYGPKVFPDFDADYIFRIAPPSVSPSPSRTTSTGSLPWSSKQSKLPKIASGFFQQAARMEWLDDRNLFNWGRTEESDVDDIFFFLDKHNGSISGRSRSGSASESESSRPVSRNRSRSNSLGEGFKVEAMTPARVSRRPVFKITDVDEDIDELAVADQKKQDQQEAVYQRDCEENENDQHKKDV